MELLSVKIPSSIIRPGDHSLALSADVGVELSKVAPVVIITESAAMRTICRIIYPPLPIQDRMPLCYLSHLSLRVLKSTGLGYLTLRQVL